MKSCQKKKRPVRWYHLWSHLSLIILFCGIGWIVYRNGKEDGANDRANLDHQMSPYLGRQQVRADASKADVKELPSKRRQHDIKVSELNSSQVETALSAMTHDQLMADKTQKLIISWASADPHDAKRWVMGIGNAQLRQPLAQYVAIGIAKTDPHAAALFVVNDFLPGNQQDESLVAVVSEWAKHDPDVVAKWLIEFPQDSMGGNAITALISIWTEKDFQASGDWLSSLPPSKFKNTGLVAYINAVRRFDENRAKDFEQMINIHL